jgi:hypothetical protein
MTSSDKGIAFPEVVVFDLASRPLPTIEGIGTRAAVDRVNAVAAVDCIIPAFAGKPVISSAAVDIVIVVEGVIPIVTLVANSPAIPSGVQDDRSNRIP